MESFFKSSSSASGSNPAKKAKIDLNVNSTCKVLSLWEWDCLIHIIFVVWHWYNSLISVIMLYSRSLQSPQVIDFCSVVLRLISVSLFNCNSGDRWSCTVENVQEERIQGTATCCSKASWSWCNDKMPHIILFFCFKLSRKLRYHITADKLLITVNERTDRECIVFLSIDWFLLSDCASFSFVLFSCWQFLLKQCLGKPLKMGSATILWCFLGFLLAFEIELGMTQKPAEEKKSKSDSFSDQVSV